MATVKKKVTTKKASSPGFITEAAPGDIPNTNPPFDARMFRAQPWAGQITRGYIREYEPPNPPDKPQGRVNFMYNPNQISYDFQLNGSLISPDETHNVPTAGAIGGNGMGFTLLFSRQFEVAYGGDMKGVHRDIDALKYVTGITSFKTGFMVMKTLMFVMGADASMVFYGYIDQMSVNIAYFSEKMVPMYAEVSLHATYVPPVDPADLHDVDATPITTQAEIAPLFVPPAGTSKSDADAYASYLKTVPSNADPIPFDMWSKSKSKSNSDGSDATNVGAGIL